MIKPVSAALGLIMATAAPALADAGNPCPAPDQPANVAVRPVDAPLQYLFDFDEQHMTTVNARDGGRPVPANMHLHGLTASRYLSYFEFQYYWQKHGAGWCTAPTTVIASVGFTDTKIYVDRRYSRGTCNRRAVLTHEAKHVAINYEEMNAGILALDATLKQAYAAAHFPIYVADKAAGEKYIADYFGYYVRHGFDLIDRRIDLRNAALDNTQEYAAIAALCPNW